MAGCPVLACSHLSAFLTILSQLTVVGDVTREQFGAQLARIRSEGNQYPMVIEEPATNETVRPDIIYQYHAQNSLIFMPRGGLALVLVSAIF